MIEYASSSATMITETRAINATMFGQVMWDGKPVIDDDDGGTAGVREPRRPHPTPLAPAAMTFELV